MPHAADTLKYELNQKIGHIFAGKVWSQEDKHRFVLPLAIRIQHLSQTGMTLPALKSWDK